MSIKGENSKIVEFFRDSTVFLTGGTGFIGKVITSKLFLTCKVSRVYLLIRKKSSKSSEERLRELFEDEVFLHLKNNVPDCDDRIKLIEGDCAHENLDISAKDEDTLCKSVDFVIHCAAAMSMMGSFKKSVEINIRGTRNLVALANKFIQLKSFVYLSTFATQWERDIIDEKLYELHLEYENCLNLLEIDHVLPMDKHDEKRITGEKVTYYATTKAAAENIFIREQISVPVVIFRFGIAMPCWREPTPGWAGNVYGPNGLFALILLNIYPVLYWNDTLFDLSPADFIVNALIASTHYSYDRFHEKKRSNEKILPFVYNHSLKKHENFLTFEEFSTFIKREFNVNFAICSNKTIFILWNILFSYIPALLADCFATLFGKKFRLFRACSTMVDLNLKFMRISKGYQVNDQNLQNCWRSLNDADKFFFPFGFNRMVWDEYMTIARISTQDYLRKLQGAQKNIRLAVFWIPKIRFAFKVLYFGLGLCCISSIYSWLN